MFGSSAVDVAIGLIFIFAVFSLLTSGIQEAIAVWLARRSKNLWDNLRMLFGTAKVDDTPLIDVFYASPFVTQLVEPNRRKKMLAATTGSGPRMRGANVANVVAVADEGEAEEAAAGRKRARIYGPTSISPASFSRALLEAIAPRGGVDATLDGVKQAIEKLAGDESDEVKRTLLRLVAEAGDDIDHFRRSLEQWFENQMDHVTEWYRRNTRLWLFIIGLVVAGLFNVDTIGAGVELWQDDDLRAIVVADASQTRAYQACQAIDDAAERTNCVEGLIDDLDNLPVGYDNGWNANGPESALRFVGWLITAAAMMAGAQFWFDLLRRAISLKGRINSALSPR